MVGGGWRWKGENNGGEEVEVVGEGDEVAGREQWWVRGDEGRGVASVCYNTFGYEIHHHPRRLAPQCMPAYH